MFSMLASLRHHNYVLDVSQSELDVSQSELVSRIALTVDDFSQMPDWLRAPTDVIGDLFKAMG